MNSFTLVVMCDAEYRWNTDLRCYDELTSSREDDTYELITKHDDKNISVNPRTKVEVYNRYVLPSNTTIVRNDFNATFNVGPRIKMDENFIFPNITTVAYTEAPEKLKQFYGANAFFHLMIEVHTSTGMADSDFEVNLDVGHLLAAAQVIGVARRISTQYSAVFMTTIIGLIKQYSDIPVIRADFKIRHNQQPYDEYDSYGLSMRAELKIGSMSFSWNPKFIAEWDDCHCCNQPRLLPTKEFSPMTFDQPNLPLVTDARQMITPTFSINLASSSSNSSFEEV